jgi:2-succinyl-6-hydroxy-2,4-cyclohexadiene-1-carboxylate synthase
VQRLRHTPDGLAASLVQHGLGEMPDLRPQLARVSVSVELLVGERDTKFVELSRELSRIIPRGRLSIAPGAGHNLLLERPNLCRELLEAPP